MHILENDFLQVKIKEHGAELCSIFNKQNNLEYLWQAGKEWPKHAPVLFPIVGQLKNNEYFFQNKKYKLERHGFARNLEFNIQNAMPASVELTLTHNGETLKVFPFHFQFLIRYTLLENKLTVTYEVTNTGTGNMYFSVGGHPAFKIPLEENETFEDYAIEFEPSAPGKIFPLQAGLICDQAENFIANINELPLSKELFYKDALVFKNAFFESVVLNNRKGKGVKMYCRDFPYFGIWSAKNADFVCLEPWLGIADSVNTSQKLENKEGIIKLNPAEKFSAAYAIEIV